MAIMKGVSRELEARLENLYNTATAVIDTFAYKHFIITQQREIDLCELGTDIMSVWYDRESGTYDDFNFEIVRYEDNNGCILGKCGDNVVVIKKFEEFRELSIDSLVKLVSVLEKVINDLEV